MPHNHCCQPQALCKPIIMNSCTTIVITNMTTITAAATIGAESDASCLPRFPSRDFRVIPSTWGLRSGAIGNLGLRVRDLGSGVVCFEQEKRQVHVNLNNCQNAITTQQSCSKGFFRFKNNPRALRTLSTSMPECMFSILGTIILMVCVSSSIPHIIHIGTQEPLGKVRRASAIFSAGRCVDPTVTVERYWLPRAPAGSCRSICSPQKYASLTTRTLQAIRV